MKRKKFRSMLVGYFGFFIFIALTVTAAVMIYQAVAVAYDGDRRAIAAIMLVVCLALALFCTTIDAVRRKYTQEKAVEEILEATEKITSGNFKILLTPRHSRDGYDEFDLIMVNLNQMAAELSKSETLKTDFIANVSHEIKTPLAIMQNYATALISDDLDKDVRASYVKTLAEASSRLTQLVTDILKLNKLENLRISPEKQTVRLDELLAQTVFAFDELMENKHIEFACDIDEITAQVVPSYLEIVWNNLFSNAVKFTPDGGKIAVSLKKSHDDAVMKISDTGCGMTEETGRRIFDKFYQGDTSHAKDGNGLGLALVKRAIDLIGGEISVESELGKGSTFTVVIKGACVEVR